MELRSVAHTQCFSLASDWRCSYVSTLDLKHNRDLLNEDDRDFGPKKQAGSSCC